MSDALRSHPPPAHRGALAPSLWPSQTLFHRIGGRPIVEIIIDRLYDRIETDPELRPMFSGNLKSERMKQKAFFEEWMGGEPDYTHHHAYGGMKSRHSHIHITVGSAERWLSHMAASLQQAVGDDALVNEVLGALHPVALGLVNEGRPTQSKKHLRCQRMKRWKVPLQLAAKGKAAALQRSIEEDTGLLSDPLQAALIVHEAALRGHVDIIKMLLAHNVDINIPAQHVVDLMITPHCAARFKGHNTLADFLIEKGAVYDIFSACFLGDEGRVAWLLREVPDLIDALDPACDFLPVTPLHHAVYGGHESVGRYLLEQGATVGTNSTAMVRSAAAQGRVGLLRLLLEHGADATRIGSGRWVLNPEVAGLVSAHGADVNYPDGQWIWTACTGNNSQRDDPEYVQALIDQGAGIYTVLRGSGPLHFAAKAGFLGTMEVLLKNGTPVDRVNDKGETPLFFALKAGRRADMYQTVKLLIAWDADPTHEDEAGRTPGGIACRMKRQDAKQISKLLER